MDADTARRTPAEARILDTRRAYNVRRCALIGLARRERHDHARGVVWLEVTKVIVDADSVTR
jgi:hypothetical protein